VPAIDVIKNEKCAFSLSSKKRGVKESFELIVRLFHGSKLLSVI